MHRFALALAFLTLVAGIPLHAQEPDEQVVIRFFCITDDLVGWQGEHVGRIQPDPERQRFLITYRGYQDLDVGEPALVMLRSLESEVFSVIGGLSGGTLYELSGTHVGEVVDSSSISLPVPRLGGRRPYGVFGNDTHRFSLYGPSLITVDGEPPHEEGDFTWMFTDNLGANDYLARGRCEIIE